jgi:hypothetical protein
MPEFATFSLKNLQILDFSQSTRCFVAAWLMLIFRKRSAWRWLRRTFPHPSVRLGTRLLRRTHQSVLTAGPDCRNKTPASLQEAYAKGGRDRVRVSLPRNRMRVAGRTRRLDLSSTRQEADRQQTHTVAGYQPGANLSDAIPCEANLILALLDGANFTGAELYETFFTAVDLGNAIGLDTCNHRGPRFIDHRTFGMSGPLALRFLPGVGLPDRLIEHMPSSRIRRSNFARASSATRQRKRPFLIASLAMRRLSRDGRCPLLTPRAY